MNEELVDLTLVAIDPRIRGMGFGTALYRLTMLECLARGYSHGQTRIVARNLPAVNLYSRLSFTFSAAFTTMHWYRAGSAG